MLPDVINHTPTTPQSELARFEALGLTVLPLGAFERLQAAEQVCFELIRWIPGQVYDDPLEEHRRREAVAHALQRWQRLARETVLRGEGIK